MIYILLGILGLVTIFVVFLFWNKPTLLIYGVILSCFVIDLFVSFLHIPESVRYLLDLLSVYLMLIGVLLMLIRPYKLYANVPFAIISVLVIIALFSFFFNDYGIVTFGIGLFQLLRGFCFFIACVCILKVEDVMRLTKLFIGMSFVNLLVSIMEFGLLGIKWDNNGGLFGTIAGCNGKMNLYIVIVTVIAAVLFINQKISTLLMAGVLISCLITATISELKIYYIELIFCIILVVIFSKPSKKTVAFVLCSGVGTIFAVFVLGVLYPRFADFFTVESLMEYSTQDYGSAEGSVNRLSGVYMIVSNYLHTPIQKLFGIGLGNGHVGTSFYKKYEYLKYIYFYTPYITLEIGISGLVTLVIFFLSNSLIALRYAFREKENSLYYMIASIISIFAIVIMVYDTSLIAVTAYLLYFWMAVPYILKKKHKYEDY